MKLLIKLFCQWLVIINILFFFSGCDSELGGKNNEEYLFPSSDFWKKGKVEIQENLLSFDIDPHSPFYFKFLVCPNPVVEEKVEGEDGRIYERGNDRYYFVIDSSLRCEYIYVYDIVLVDNNNDIKSNAVKKKISYTISMKDYVELLNKIIESKILGYEEFCAEENPEHTPFTELEIRSQGGRKNLWYGHSMPREMHSLYDFIREELILKYISKMNLTWQHPSSEHAK